MNTLVTSQYQPRLSSIAKIFSRRISQSDCSIQIKLNYYRIISNIPTDIKKCLKDNIDNFNTENFQPKDDFLDRLINTKSLKFVYYFTEDINSSSHSKIFEMGRNTWNLHCRLVYIFSNS